MQTTITLKGDERVTHFESMDSEGTRWIQIERQSTHEFDETTNLILILPGEAEDRALVCDTLIAALETMKPVVAGA